MITSPIKFLGAYVIQASCNLGWGGETSTCSITLVEDPQNNIKFLPANPTSGIGIGSPCLFRIGTKFQFGGILQRWTYSENTGDGRKYEVVLESPSKLLDGVTVVLNSFQGTIYKSDDINVVATQATTSGIMTYGGSYPTNIINVFASKENYEANGTFGNSNVNDFGYPVSGIVSDYNSTVNNSFALVDGSAKFGGKIVYNNAEYSIDLTALDEVIPYIKDYRINGNFITINSLIRDITDVALYDYIYTLTGTANTYGVITKNAKISLVVKSRREPPVPGIINDTINKIKNLPDSQKQLISYNVGKELSDTTTQKVLIGGQASRYWMSSRLNNDIYPVWGKKGEGILAQYSLGQLDDYTNWDKEIEIVLDGGYTSNFTTVTTNLLELRCAMSGRDTWNMYHMLRAIKAEIYGDPTYKKIMVGNVNFTLKQFQELIEGKAVVNDLLDTALESGEIIAQYLLGKEYQTAYIQDSINSRFKSIENAAAEFYGRTFGISVPMDRGGFENNIKYLYDGIERVTAWNIAGSAWSGSTYRSLFLDPKYYDDNGRFQAVAIYDNVNTADYSGLGEDYSLINNFGIVTGSLSIDPDLSWQIFSGKDSITGEDVEFVKGIAIARLNAIVTNYDQYSTETNGFNILCQLILGKRIPIGYQNLFNGSQLEVPIAPAPLIPKNIGIPQESSRYVWGPWFSFNRNAGKQGKLEIIEDSQFSPETFGSLEKMNEYAQTIVNCDASQVYETESGYIELAEEPQFNLADRFLKSGPYITNLSISVGADGVKTQYQFSSWTKSFGRIAKYNIDRIARLQGKSFQFYKKIRDLFRNPIPKAIDRSLIAHIEKSQKKPESKGFEVQGIFGNFVGLLSFNINNQNVTYTDPQTAPSPSTSRGFSSFLNTPVEQGGSTPSVPKLVVNGASIDSAMPTMGLNYEESFGCSMEQIFSPVVSFKQDQTGGLEGYPTRTANNNFPSLQIDPTSVFPSFEKARQYNTTRDGLFYNNNISPTSKDLDPYFAFTNDFSFVVKDDRYHTTDINLAKDEAKYYVKTMGLRGPLILSGWGYDSAGLPVPSSGDSGDAGWTFSATAGQDRTKWKNGPVDLRWNKDRKVWVGGHDVVEGILIEDIATATSFASPSTAKMKVFRTVYQPSGANQTLESKDEFITITNRDPSLFAGIGAYVMAVEINYEWRPLWVECTALSQNNVDTGG